MDRLLKILFSIVAMSGLGALVFRLSRAGVRVLMYHGVCSEDGARAPFGGRGKHVPVDLFHRQMRWLRRHARLMSIDDLVARLESGAALPARGVVVTLDDGYRNNHEHALPALLESRVPAAVYVTTGFVAGRPFWTDRVDDAVERTMVGVLRGPQSGEEWPLASAEDRRLAAARLRRAGKKLAGADRESLVGDVTRQAGRDLAEVPAEERPLDTQAMSVEMIQAVSRAGVTVGSHTVSHEILSRCADVELEKELGESRRTVASWLGGEVAHFAYPNGAYGDFDERTEGALRAAGYRSALLTVQGTVRPGHSPFQIRRRPVNGDEGMPEFIADLCGLRPALVALRTKLFPR